MQIKIIGAGISGLSAAFFLREAGFSVAVYEARARSGGMISTKKRQFGIAESAANAVVNSERFEALCAAIGVELVGAMKASKARYIVRGKPRRWPLAFSESMAFLRGVFRFWRNSKLTQSYPVFSESMADFCERYFGKAAVDYLIGPALRGIYGSDSEKLSASLVVNSMLTSRKNRSQLKIRGSVAPKSGMGDLIEKLQASLEKNGVEFHFSEEVRGGMDLKSGPWVLATSMREAEKILEPVFPQAAARLAGLKMVPLVTVTAFLEKSAIRYPGFGCLFPADQGFRALGVLSNTHIFPARTNAHSETWIFSDDGNQKLQELSDSQILENLRSDRRKLVGFDADFLDYQITRWPDAIPLYGLELEKFLQSGVVEGLEGQNIFLHGNYLGRIGLAAIIERSFQLAERIRGAF